MREISIALGPSINPGDIEIEKTATSKMSHKDHLLLNLEAADAHETGRILAVLEKEEMEFRHNSSHGGQKYTIIATPRSKDELH